VGDGAADGEGVMDADGATDAVAHRPGNAADIAVFRHPVAALLPCPVDRVEVGEQSEPGEHPDDGDDRPTGAGRVSVRRPRRTDATTAARTIAEPSKLGNSRHTVADRPSWARPAARSRRRSSYPYPYP
jgi:hypothetical protein